MFRVLAAVAADALGPGQAWVHEQSGGLLGHSSGTQTGLEPGDGSFHLLVAVGDTSSDEDLASVGSASAGSTSRVGGTRPAPPPGGPRTI